MGLSGALGAALGLEVSFDSPLSLRFLGSTGPEEILRSARR